MAARKRPARGSKPDKLWRDALMRAVKRRAKGKGASQRLELIADKCVEGALDGDMQAIKEIGDRLDGKPTQAITGDPEQPNRLVVEIIDPTRREQ